VSTGHDRRRKAQRAQALLNAALLEEPRTIGHAGEWELIRRGAVIFAVPQIRADYP
jgi:hypothetical protein